MTWIAASLLMFAFSVLTYLGVRKNTLLKTPPEINNLAMFLLPALTFGFWIAVSNKPFLLTPYQFLITIILAIFFAYFGNRFSMLSIDRAPNPGYSLVISKSYVVLTSIAAILLFNQELTLKNGLAILLIVGFSPLVMISEKDQSVKGNKGWLLLALGALLCWAMLSLTSKYLLLLGVSVVPRLFWATFISSLLILNDIRSKKINLKTLKKQQWITFICIGIGSSLFNYFMQVGYDIAPNVGYINAVNAASIAALTIFSKLLFKDELTSQKLVGIFGVIAGLIVLVL